MFAWIAENYGALIVGAVLIAVVAAIIIGMIRKKKKGRSVICDCGNCRTCPMSGSCHGSGDAGCQMHKK